MPVARIAALALAGLAAGCAATSAPNEPPAPSGSVRVRLMHRESAVPGAAVTAVRNPGVALLEERVGAVSGPDGRAEILLAPGIWYLSASAVEPAVFGWFGSNPVQVRSREALEVTMPAVPAVPPPAVTAAAPGEETVAGVLLGEDGPVAGAAVTFYLDATTQFRGPGYLESRTGENGAFETRVSPGRYWLVARRRAGTQPYGPLEVGDDFGFAAANPVEVRSGQRVTLSIPAVRVLKRTGWAGASALRARVSGTIRDAAGRPLPGFRAFLHGKAAMLGKPDFVSEPSGPDGGYQIWVDREGVFFLGARAEIGKARDDREAIGVYGAAADHAVEVRLGEGDLTGRDIVVGESGR